VLLLESIQSKSCLISVSDGTWKQEKTHPLGFKTSKGMRFDHINSPRVMRNAWTRQDKRWSDGFERGSSSLNRGENGQKKFFNLFTRIQASTVQIVIRRKLILILTKLASILLKETLFCSIFFYGPYDAIFETTSILCG